MTNDPTDRPTWPPDAGADNPYAAPGSVRSVGGGLSGASPPNGGMVRHVMPVAILMIVQGALELLLAVLFLALIVAVPFMLSDLPADGGAAQEVGGAPTPAFLKTMMMATYGVMGTGGLIAGVLHVAAGIFGLRFRRRMLGIVALAVGMVSITTCYCAPTAIGLAIYGLITYCNPAVVAAFGLGDAGVPVADIRARCGG